MYTHGIQPKQKDTLIGRQLHIKLIKKQAGLVGQNWSGKRIFSRENFYLLLIFDKRQKVCIRERVMCKNGILMKERTTLTGHLIPAIIIKMKAGLVGESWFLKIIFSMIEYIS